jgi:hypothetical protein
VKIESKFDHENPGYCQDFVMPGRKELPSVSAITFILIDIGESEVKNGGSTKFDLSA